MEIIKSILLNILIIFTIISCHGNGSIGDGKYTTSPKFGLNGAVQKGPFVSGTTILIQELDNNLLSIGKTYQTTTTDDFGSFVIGSNIKSRYVEVMATGYYFDEVAGSLSASTLTLRAVADLQSGTDVNINLLTTLEIDRIKYLIITEGKTYTTAKAQVENEILAIFNIPSDNITSFEKMDISKEGNSNAILLAISSMLQADNTVAQLSELISKINLDIKSDGTLDTASLVSEISANSKYINTVTIRTNLLNRYAALGLTITVPNFSDFVDSDYDGLLNKDDDDVPDVATFSNIEEAWSFDAQTVETAPLTVAGLAAAGTTEFSITDSDNHTHATIIKNSQDVGTSTTVQNGDELIIRHGFPDKNATPLPFHLGEHVLANITWGNPSSGETTSTVTFTATEPTVAQAIASMIHNQRTSTNSGVYFAQPFTASSNYTARYVLTPARGLNTVTEICIYSNNAGVPGSSLACTGSSINIMDYTSDFDMTGGGTYSVPTNVYIGYIGAGLTLTSGTNYWVVMKLWAQTTFEAVQETATTSYANRKYSTDVSNPTNWNDWTEPNSTPAQLYGMAILEFL